jgi:hypothetical protein
MPHHLDYILPVIFAPFLCAVLGYVLPPKKMTLVPVVFSPFLYLALKYILPKNKTKMSFPHIDSKVVPFPYNDSKVIPFPHIDSKIVPFLTSSIHIDENPIFDIKNVNNIINIMTCGYIKCYHADSSNPQKFINLIVHNTCGSIVEIAFNNMQKRCGDKVKIPFDIYLIISLITSYIDFVPPECQFHSILTKCYIQKSEHILRSNIFVSPTSDIGYSLSNECFDFFSFINANLKNIPVPSCSSTLYLNNHTIKILPIVGDVWDLSFNFCQLKSLHDCPLENEQYSTYYIFHDVSPEKYRIVHPYLQHTNVDAIFLQGVCFRIKSVATNSIHPLHAKKLGSFFVIEFEKV